MARGRQAVWTNHAIVGTCGAYQHQFCAWNRGPSQVWLWERVSASLCCAPLTKRIHSAAGKGHDGTPFEQEKVHCRTHRLRIRRDGVTGTQALSAKGLVGGGRSCYARSLRDWTTSTSATSQIDLPTQCPAGAHPCLGFVSRQVRCSTGRHPSISPLPFHACCSCRLAGDHHE